MNDRRDFKKVPSSKPTIDSIREEKRGPGGRGGRGEDNYVSDVSKAPRIALDYFRGVYKKAMQLANKVEKNKSKDIG